MADCPNNDAQLNGAFPDKSTAGTSPAGLKIDQSGVGGANAVFNVNKLATAAQNYNALNTVVNQLIGYDARWFRAVPQQRSKDVIFLEYTLSNVEDCPVELKVVLGSGMPPDSKYNFDLMGLEYDVPFEVQIDKKYWESKAGFGTAPQKKDIVYFPISNKIFEVESCYLFRGFMEQETAWKCNLRKYSPEASRRESTGLHETIDKYTVSVEEIFGGAIESDVKKLVDDQQMNQFNGTSKDKYKYFDASLKTIPSTINMYGTVVAQSFYDMQTPSVFNAIQYNTQDIIHNADDRSIIAWTMPRTIPSIHKEYDVATITSIVGSSLDPSTIYQYDPSLYSSANYSIAISTPASLTNIGLDDYVTISRPGALNFYAKVVAIDINPLVYHCNINAYVLADLDTIKSDWADQRGYKLTVKDPINIIDGMNDFDEHIFSVNIFANQYIAFNYGFTFKDDVAYVLRLPKRLEDNKWYGIVINVGNSWEQYNVNVWEKHISDADAKLQRIYYKTLAFFPEEISVSNFTVNKSPSYLTNLKIYSSTIEEENQSRDLLSYFSKDGDQIIIADNADSILKIPYIGKQR